MTHDAERRAKRIAGRYAELYFRSKEKSQNKIHFYWVALAAFIVKDIVYVDVYIRERVLTRRMPVPSNIGRKRRLHRDQR